MKRLKSLNDLHIGKKITCTNFSKGDCTSYVKVTAVYDNGFVAIPSWRDSQFVYTFNRSTTGQAYEWLAWEPKVVELTMDEIAEKFDIPVEQLKIKK